MINDTAKILTKLAANQKLLQLITLMYISQEDGIEFPLDKLVGDWDNAKAGMRVKVTFTDPYKVEDGILMVLPGLADDLLKWGIVYVPDSNLYEGNQTWYCLKYLACLCDTIELETLW